MRFYYTLIIVLFIVRTGFSRTNQMDDSVKYSLPFYDNPNKYISHNFSFKSDHNLVLKGTQLKPKKEQKAICIFVHTIGSQDRDATFNDSKIFKDIAIGLAVKQITSYRYDKRIYTYPTAKNSTIYEETINDVVKLIDYVASDSSNENIPIYIMAHGFASLLAPEIIQSTTHEITGIISLGAIARPLEDLLLDQFTYLVNEDGCLTSSEKEELDKLEGKVNFLKKGMTDSTDSNRLPLSIPVSYWMSLSNYHTLKEIENKDIPMLFLYGNNKQSTFQQDALLWKKYTNSSQTKFISFDKLDNSFSPILNKEKVSNRRKNVHIQVIDTIWGWIK